MTSQVSSTKALTTAVTELSVGDVVHGVNQTTWVHSYRIYEGPHKSSLGGGYLKFIVGRTGSGYENERTPWNIGDFNQVMIEDRTFKYDPRQAGDTDEDI